MLVVLENYELAEDVDVAFVLLLEAYKMLYPLEYLVNLPAYPVLLVHVLRITIYRNPDILGAGENELLSHLLVDHVTIGGYVRLGEFARIANHLQDVLVDERLAPYEQKHPFGERTDLVSYDFILLKREKSPAAADQVCADGAFRTPQVTGQTNFHIEDGRLYAVEFLFDLADLPLGRHFHVSNTSDRA